ncbi:hypothetical protein [Sphingomonas sp.]|uniref:hypothetical protein n=1 Tax=Sphingomonas sp. TaxID=28214 RepID=UPI0025CB8559|nr:hypothetical protein [Sphingomonas sp.]MBV9529134.1 hypothetical protein [Sphingomonas sp.]
MEGGQIMVVCIVAIVMLASIFKARSKFNSQADLGDDSHSENARLRDEVAQLKERLKVLERITVEKENSLAREIDQLRDR